MAGFGDSKYSGVMCIHWIELELYNNNAGLGGGNNRLGFLFQFRCKGIKGK